MAVASLHVELRLHVDQLVAVAASHLAVLHQLVDLPVAETATHHVLLHQLADLPVAVLLVAEAATHHVLLHLAVLPSVAVATSRMWRKVGSRPLHNVLTTRMDGKS